MAEFCIECWNKINPMILNGDMFFLGIRNCANNVVKIKESSFQNGFGHECKGWWRKQWKIPKMSSTAVMHYALTSYLFSERQCFIEKKTKETTTSCQKLSFLLAHTTQFDTMQR